MGTSLGVTQRMAVSMGQEVSPTDTNSISEGVTATHAAPTPELLCSLSTSGIRVIGIQRNLLDHLLSCTYDQDIATLNADQLAQGWFGEWRRHMRELPTDIQVSYDILADRSHRLYPDECRRVEKILDLPSAFRVLSWERTAAYAIGPRNSWSGGRPGRWKEVIPRNRAEEICRAFGEDCPEDAK